MTRTAAQARTAQNEAFDTVRAAEQLSAELSTAMFATDPLLAGPRRDELREKLRVARIAELEARATFRKAIADARALS